MFPVEGEAAVAYLGPSLGRGGWVGGSLGLCAAGQGTFCVETTGASLCADLSWDWAQSAESKYFLSPPFSRRSSMPF